ncbi:MAG: hypothetical protein GY906_31470 [bacterium]|nr:hypothetical protein [bacterium]
MQWMLPLLLVVPLCTSAEGPVAVVQNHPPRLILTNLPHILTEKGVRQELDSGLTTAVVISVYAKNEAGTKLRGGARVDIRYELWEEVYSVMVSGGDGRLRETQVGSFEELLDLWANLSFGVVQDDQLAEDRPWSLEIEASFVPFSQGEQHKAQLWIERSLDPAHQLEDLRSSRSTSRALSVLVATSIKRRAVVEFKWKTQVVGETFSEVEDGS